MDAKAKMMIISSFWGQGTSSKSLPLIFKNSCNVKKFRDVEKFSRKLQQVVVLGATVPFWDILLKGHTSDQMALLFYALTYV